MEDNEKAVRTEAGERLRLRQVIKVVAMITIAVVGLALYFGVSTARYMKEILRSQFNNQQLVLAKTTASRIETGIQNAITDLILLNSSPTIQYCDPEAYEALLLSTLPVLNRDHLQEIRRVDRDGNTMFVADEQGVAMKHLGLVRQEAGVYLSWASDMSNRGKTTATGIRTKEFAKDKKRILIDLVVPTYEDSSDAQHPRPTHRFAGYLAAILNVSGLLQETVLPVRSGKTGYAWVIDSSGTFLYHPDPSFIGENAFEVRAYRDRDISFEKINEIQRNEMMKGKEGAGSYTSGRHRDLMEPMEKLIAYAPMRVEGPHMSYVWSVAVVAPAEEIEGNIHSVYQCQFILQGIIIFIIILGTVVIILYELRWSTVLEHEVVSKTRDISRYASELERSEAKYRSLVESAEDLIFMVDTDGILKAANQHTARLFGMGNEEIAGQSLFRFLPRDQADQQLGLVRKVLRGGQRVCTENVLRLGEEDFWFNFQYLPVKGDAGGPVHVLGIARDITERKSLEKQLINAEKLASLGTLAAGVAHEINNPLGIMLGFCDLLLERMDPGTMEYNDLKTIERHGLHCKSIVERLLSFARISEETEDFCDLNANVESIVNVVRHTLGLHKIQLVTSLEEALPPVRGDSRGIQQVLLNLINNAVYAMNGQGILTITTRQGRKTGYAEMVVEDTGIGIKGEFLQKIFDPFFTTKKVGDGTGLGLSVSYGIVAKYGGNIECESYTREDRPGRSGTTFIVILPFKEDVPSHSQEITADS